MPANNQDIIQTDSLSVVTPATDSVMPYYAPQWTDGFPQPVPGDSTIESVSSYPVMDVPHGLAPACPLNSVLGDTGTMSLVMLGVLFVVMSYRSGYKYIESFFHNMFSTRRRENVFEDHTVNETQILTALILNTCIMEGVLMFYGLGMVVPSVMSHLHSAVFAHVGAFSALALIFYLAQLLVYNIVGNVFADSVATKLWTDGFKASQSLLGILLFPIVAVLMVRPELCKILLTSAIILYFCSRIVFICKGFRIFYSKLPSLVYFILYLCSVEIVPLSLMSALTINLCTLLKV